MRRAALALAALALAACEEATLDRREVTSGGAVMRGDDRAPEGSVARGDAAGSTAPPAVTLAGVERGRERYDIFCAACHGRTGHGDGIVTRRGFTAPPSFHGQGARALSRAGIVRVITEGTGDMWPMAERIPERDRWAIADYVGALRIAGEEAER